MSVTFENVGSAVVIGLLGRLDSANSGPVETELLGRIMGGSGGVIIDMTRLDYISSAGLRVVLVVAKRMKHAGRGLVLCGLQPNIRDVFDISGFLGILEVTRTQAEAIAKVG